jgi:heptosyltransferase-1
MALPGWKKVLVVDLGFLGDTVHSIPALRALSAQGARVDVMTTPVGSEVLSMVPEIHRVWVTPLRKPSPPWWQGVAQLRQIRAQKYHSALTFSGADRGLVCVALSGARERIAATQRHRWWHGLLPLTKTISAPLQNQPLFRQKIETLRSLGWSGDPPDWSLQISSEMEKRVSPSLTQPTVYLSVSAYGSPHKEWPLKSWAEMVRRVWEKRPEIKFLIGFAASQREEDRARQLGQLLGNPAGLQVLDSPPSLVELASILRRAVCFVGLDSGVLHFAVALGRPTVSIFRDYAGKLEWAPEGKTHRVVSQFCSCHHDQIDRCGAEPQCLAAVTSQEVAGAVLELLPQPRGRA